MSLLANAASRASTGTCAVFADVEPELTQHEAWASWV